MIFQNLIFVIVVSENVFRIVFKKRFFTIWGFCTAGGNSENVFKKRFQHNGRFQLAITRDLPLEKNQQYASMNCIIEFVKENDSIEAFSVANFSENAMKEAFSFNFASKTFFKKCS
jgi:hypothetical protein